ncbi:hypothetical protein D3C77_263920 [compost metagenome]
MGIRLQRRVVLDDNKQAAKRALKLLIGCGQLVRRTCPAERGSGIGNFLNYFFFMLGIAFDGVDQIGNQIVSPLQLNVDFAPLLVYCFFGGHELIVISREQGNADNDNRRNDNEGNQTAFSL